MRKPIQINNVHMVQRGWCSKNLGWNILVYILAVSVCVELDFDC